jgi:hypothetical protein
MSLPLSVDSDEVSLRYEEQSKGGSIKTLNENPMMEPVRLGGPRKW